MFFKTLFAAAAFAAGTSAASAAVINTTGNVSLINAPALVNNAVPDSDTTAYVFEESTVWLTSNLLTSTGVISAGQWVKSYMLFLNQEPGRPNAVSARGTVTFSETILGLITSTALVNATNALLGASGTTYNLAMSNTGLERGDSLTASGSTASFLFNVTQPGDWTRVVATATVPLPASVGLLGFAIAGLFGLRRRGARAAA